MKKSKLIKLKQHYLQHRHDDAIFNENLHKTVPNVTVDVYLESCDLKNSKEEKSTYFDDIDEASYISREELLYREDYLNYLEGIGYWNEDYIFLEQNNEQVEWWDMVGRQEDSKLVSIESILPLYKKFKCINSCMTSANNVPVDIEQYLFDFSENIFNSGVESTPNYAALKQYLLCPCDVHIVNKTYNNYDLSKYIFIFSPFWIRSPSTWDKEGGKGLLEHLFVLYEVPSVLKKAWFQGDVKFIQWFLLYAQGGSLKKANKIFGWSIGSDKLWSKLYGVPTRLSLLSAVIYAEIDRLGGSNRIYNCIINDSSFAIDIINMDCENKPSLVFWYDTVRWLICNCGISETAMRRILAWARHKYTESREDKRRFSLGRKKFITVIIRASTYHQQINRYGYSCKQTVNRQSWKSHNWDWELKTSDEALWEMKELTDSYVLYMEGREMRHCVSSYAGRCLSGCSAIFSLGYNGVKKVTIEVNPLSKVLNQVKGFANKEPTSE